MKWWQYDPTKWLIWSCSKLGLAKNLRRIPSFNIKKAELAMRFKYAEQDLAVYGHNVNEDMATAKLRIAQEYEAFTQTLNDWAKLKNKRFKSRKLQWLKRFIKWIINSKLIFSCLNSVLRIIAIR